MKEFKKGTIKSTDLKNVLNIYMFGSKVYGTANENSDDDSIMIAREYFNPLDINIHVYTLEQFQLLLDNCDIQALECMSLPDSLKYEEFKFTFNIDKYKLRTSISTIASNSWVKGKKKITVLGDYDLNIGLKSIFHSLRILDFGIQLASGGKISNYSSMNYVLEELRKLSENYSYNELWTKIDEKFRSTYNSLSSRFKQLAPKNLDEVGRKNRIKNILLNYDIENETLLNELFNL